MASVTTDRRLGVNSGIAVKAPCVVAAIIPITLSGEQTVAGVAVQASNDAGVPDRVLVTAQADATTNGVYDVSTGSWSRSKDFDGTVDVTRGTMVPVYDGTTYTQWVVSTALPITIDSTAIHFAQQLNSTVATQLGDASNVAYGDALVAVKSVLTGGSARTQHSKNADFVSLSDFNDGVRTYTQQWTAAVTSGTQKLYVDVGGTLTAQITVPDNMVVWSDFIATAVAKGFNGDLFVLGNNVVFSNIWIQGNGATWTGRGAVINSTATRQTFQNVTITDMEGYCLEFVGANAGGVFLWAGGLVLRNNATLTAIKLPASESLVEGTRRFDQLHTDGGILIDLSGGNMTFIDQCIGAIAPMTSSVKQVYISGCRTGAMVLDGSSNPVMTGCAVGGSITINGTCVGAQISNCNVAGSLILNVGATQCRADGSNNFQTGVTDNSASNTNYLWFEADFTPIWGGDGGTPTLGNGTFTGRGVRRGRSASCRMVLTLGGTTVIAGTGNWFVQLPAPWNLTVKKQAVGRVGANDSSVGALGFFSGAAVTAAGAAPKYYFYPSTIGDRWGPAVPIAWASGDFAIIDVEHEMG